MSVPTLVVTPGTAIGAYQRTSAAGALGAADGVAAGAGGGGEAFGDMVGRALQGAIATGQEADTSATNAVINGGDLTHVVTAVSKAQLALQEVVSIRDKVVSAYQEIMRMSI